MFYITNSNKDIYINRILDSLTAYKLIYKNKDEYNIQYEENILPTYINSRYTMFISTLYLKKGTYKFYIYHNGSIIYTDICQVGDYYQNRVNIEDDNDKKIIID